MKKLLITGWVPEDCLTPFRGKMEIILPEEEKRYFVFDEVKEMISDCDALFTVKSFPCKKELIDIAPKLKIVGNHGVGYDNIDYKYATEKGIFVVNTPVAVCEATAEFTIAIMMAATRGVVQYDKNLRGNLLCNIGPFYDRYMLLFGKTLGVLGLGRIGKAVAKKALGLGMQVVYFDPFRLAPEKEKELNVRYASFDEVISTSDVVTCHMPFMPETRHLINRDVFRKMKKTAYFVNAARGGVMCEADLVEALKAGDIRGAAVDVFEFEPKVSEQLASLDNVVITPHVASNVLEVRKNMALEILTGIDSIFSGNRPHNVVNPELFDSVKL